MLPSLLSFKQSKNQPARKKSPIIDSAKENYFSYLPDEEILIDFFNDAYVINRPLDTVGGDGYWIYQDKTTFFLVAFDCMGHGRLASMMTRNYIEQLEIVIGNEKEYDPASILTAIHQKIKSQFEKKENIQIGVGADMAIVKYEADVQKLYYSGAKMELFQIDAKGKTNRIKACKRSLGTYFDYDRDYITSEIPFDQKDKFYLFSDGITDLFGGSNDKKLGLKGFMKMLEEITNKGGAMDSEKAAISEKLTRWSGNKTRLDDMLLISFRP